MPIGLSPAGILVRPSQRDFSSYHGQNAFGATVLVRTSRERFLTLSFCDAANAPASCLRLAPQQLEFALPPGRAATARERLRVLIVGTPRPPFARERTEYSRAATIDRPYEGSRITSTLDLTVVEAMVYDFGTGEILDRIRP